MLKCMHKLDVSTGLKIRDRKILSLLFFCLESRIFIFANVYHFTTVDKKQNFVQVFISVIVQVCFRLRLRNRNDRDFAFLQHLKNAASVMKMLFSFASLASNDSHHSFYGTKDSAFKFSIEKKLTLINKTIIP